ncbi:MAG TPA: DUF924 family protein [Woeseiaceae bacterium]|jgi:uncharacterized protein (DUF924 family)|nr:DUF924 family protein [Woeseiaceae bacterium]
MHATISNADTARIDAILSFWFKEQALSAPQIDRRMDIWFGEDAVFDQECKVLFADDVEKASNGELDHWAEEPRGRLALILLLDQFRRNIYRGTADAYAKDNAALKLCVEGAMAKKTTGLTPIQQAFFYMPLQHAESRKVQARSVALFHRLAEAVSPTYRETFETMAQFAELHHDIIEQFDRFPHRNKLLGRENTAEEDEYLADAPDFGQG